MQMFFFNGLAGRNAGAYIRGWEPWEPWEPLS
jgi:hypothetical protein